MAVKIRHISIRNFRSIEKLDMPVNNYTALVGANGAGKSSVLYALDWMLNGRPLFEHDVHRIAPAAEGEPDRVVSVELTFGDFTAADRRRLEKYGRGQTLTVKKQWGLRDPKPKLIGKSLQGPGFAKVRAAGPIAEARAEYVALRAAFPSLPEPDRLAKAAELDLLLSAWEDDPANQALLVPVEGEDVTAFFGFDGQNRLKQCLRMVLVPAASDIPSEVAGVRRGSAVNDLIGALMGEAGAEARHEWIEKYAAAIEELTSSMREKVAKATGLEAARINKRLQELVSNSSLSFTPEIPAWLPSPVPTVTTDVSIDGISNDVALQGHGIQRAVMIAMFESLAPDEEIAEREHSSDGEEPESEAAARLQAVKDELPSLLVCIEEPEIYQHPIRARAFARVLADLANQPRAQVMLATHSPYFVTPARFESLRRFTLLGGKSNEAHTTIASVASATVGAEKEEKVGKTVSQQLPTAFSEAFFADSVVLVEGLTDRVVLERVAERLGVPFDAVGIAIVGIGGKGSLRIPNGILDGLGIPTYLVADGDALGAARKGYADATGEASAHGSHKAECEDLVAWLPTPTNVILGTAPYSFEAPTIVSDTYTIWNDDLETELASWPSFVAAQAANGHSPRSKNVLSYRADVDDAELGDLPESISKVIEEIHRFRIRQ